MSPSDEAAERAKSVGYVYALEKQAAMYRKEIDAWKSLVAYASIVAFATGATIGVLVGWLNR